MTQPDSRRAETPEDLDRNDSALEMELRQGVIRKLLVTEEPLVRDHFLQLDAESRRRRFFREVSDDYLRQYAMKIAEPGTIIYGYLVDGEVKAVAELKRTAFSGDQTAEAAFSVEAKYSNSGIGTALMERIILSARNRGLKHLVLVCLPNNVKMQAIAAKFATELHIEEGASIADIIPKSADYVSLAREAFADRIGLVQAFFDLDARIIRTLVSPIGHSNLQIQKSIAG